MKALASMAFFALPDVAPPEGGLETPFHGLDMNQFDALIDIEDAVFNQLTAQNNNDTNGVRPFSVCETRFMIETYVRPLVAYPGFAPYKAAYETYAASCLQKDKDEWPLLVQELGLAWPAPRRPVQFPGAAGHSLGRSKR